jgi:hypothetical protein
MINFWYSLWFVRYFKGGIWVKTEKRGWISDPTYREYISYGFDPVILRVDGVRPEINPEEEKMKERQKKLKKLL